MPSSRLEMLKQEESMNNLKKGIIQAKMQGVTKLIVYITGISQSSEELESLNATIKLG